LFEVAQSFVVRACTKKKLKFLFEFAQSFVVGACTKVCCFFVQA
jgi:hypothetical protein